MWKHGAYVAAVVGVLLACSGEGGGGGQWYEHKPVPNLGAAGTGNEDADQSAAGTGERPDDTGSTTSEADGEETEG